MSTHDLAYDVSPWPWPQPNEEERPVEKKLLLYLVAVLVLAAAVIVDRYIVCGSCGWESTKDCLEVMYALCSR